MYFKLGKSPIYHHYKNIGSVKSQYWTTYIRKPLHSVIILYIYNSVNRFSKYPPEWTHWTIKQLTTTGGVAFSFCSCFVQGWEQKWNKSGPNKRTKGEQPGGVTILQQCCQNITVTIVRQCCAWATVWQLCNSVAGLSQIFQKCACVCQLNMFWHCFCLCCVLRIAWHLAVHLLHTCLKRF